METSIFTFSNNVFYLVIYKSIYLSSIYLFYLLSANAVGFNFILAQIMLFGKELQYCCAVEALTLRTQSEYNKHKLNISLFGRTAKLGWIELDFSQ